MTRLARLVSIALIVAASSVAAPPPVMAESSRLRATAPDIPDLGVRYRGADTGRIMDSARPRPPIASGGSGHRRTPMRMRYGWFWKTVPTAIGGRDQRSWGQVLSFVGEEASRGRALYGSGRVVDRILRDYGPILEREAARRNVSLPLLVSVIAVESGGNLGAKSPVGAQGLMQLMPQTAARFGIDDAYDPVKNIRGGAAYLDWLLKHFRGDVVLALAGYNAGEGAVRRHGGVPPYRETRDYVAKVAGAYRVAMSRCQTPPVSVRQGCERG